MNKTDDVASEFMGGGGEWLGAARKWMQENIREGDTLYWNSNEPVSIAFCDLERFARTVAIAAVREDRRKRTRN